MKNKKFLYNPRFFIRKICPKGRLIKSRRDLIKHAEVIPNFALYFFISLNSTIDAFQCKKWDNNCRGQSATEYILLSLILIIAALGINELFSKAIAKYFNHVSRTRTGWQGLLP